MSNEHDTRVVQEENEKVEMNDDSLLHQKPRDHRVGEDSQSIGLGWLENTTSTS